MGAEWFESVLIDYEPAANWFCWAFICLVRATGGNGFRDVGHPELTPGRRLQTVEVVFLSAQHDPDGEYIKQWVPELSNLSGLQVREPWRATGPPVAAADSRSGGRVAPQVQVPATGPYRIQQARRTLTRGGPEVAVWWSCVRGGQKASALAGWPQGYKLPILPPSSFFTIEEVADIARRNQLHKAERIARLRQELGPPKSSVQAFGYVEPMSDDRTSQQQETPQFVETAVSKSPVKRRWGRTAQDAGSAHGEKAGTSYYSAHNDVMWQGA
eukprot:gnl/TRDRNA2_/TRDRNA2_159416_c1_seq1.p1 gnl/TRDRNA2_/TRDRNA2_159416_c1~~gnl/TRDRNA2_/TRDRNA2_159416_c1_seq1.p1  ORF type:complete len:271 (-),score=39.51 gnl/TRDRNA2_/TRDRNA2_159416_c1_seq1:167-979(-)